MNIALPFDGLKHYIGNEVQGNFGPILTQNPQMKEVIKTVARVANTNANVLIIGESGTGKNLLSRAIHNASSRHKGPYVAVNCISVSDTLIESELFGHEKGSFTGAYQSKQGYFEASNGGTIFLDEIGDMSPLAQGKILQIVDEKKFRRVGSEKLIQTDTRVVSATHRDLTEKITQGKFREDLFYRLSEVTIHVPPLRERKEDIPLLIRHFVSCYGQMYGKPNLKISDAAVDYLSQYRWPGNFREMKHVIKSAVLLCPQDTVWLEHFPFEITPTHNFQLSQGESPTSSQDLSLENFLQKHILRSLLSYHWNKRKTAAALEISRPRLDRYIEKYHLQKIDSVSK